MTEIGNLKLKNRLFVEKFRPNTLDEVVGHHEVVKILKAFAAAGMSLEFLFSGPPASGKTTAAIAFAKDLYGKNWDRNFTELNASDERGIDIVRGKIKDFARTSPISASFKLIFLDEVDELCVPEGTKIIIGSGTEQRFEKIEDVPEDKYISMQSVNLETGEIEKDKGMCVHSGYADFWKITLANGDVATTSEHHPFFVEGRKEIWMRDIEIDTKILDFTVESCLIHCAELVKVIKKEYIGRGKAYNITMKKNPCFFLHNGILTHNTIPAQSALRRTIEKYSNTCRFVLSCNYDNKLIAPIKSRLMSFHFAGLSDDDMRTLVYRVIGEENLQMPEDAVDLLVELSDRDTRVLLNTLQVCALLSSDISAETVKNTLQVPDKKQVHQMISSAISGDLDLAFEISANHIINSGFDVKKILRMIDKTLPMIEMHKNTRGKLLGVISDVEDRINHGGTPDIQMRALLSKFDLIANINPVCPIISQAQ